MITLKKTCGACPEQYDAYDADGNKVGYLRLRHGFFYAQAEGTCVYEAYTLGDGIFQEDERHQHLSLAVTAIESHLQRQKDGEEPQYPLNYVIEEGEAT